MISTAQATNFDTTLHVNSLGSNKLKKMTKDLGFFLFFFFKVNYFSVALDCDHQASGVTEI